MDGGYTSSAYVFPRHRYTFVVFWDSNCPHCVESLLGCEDFYAARADEDVAVVGIHIGAGDMAEAYRLIESNGITFPQLWDSGDETSRQYGAELATSSVFLVDRGGRIVAQRTDPSREC
jgi:peroxiredoxin